VNKRTQIMRALLRIFDAFSSIVYFGVFVIGVAMLNLYAHTSTKITPVA
jgi:hypothetical protein